ncbi:MAG: hypothetical protein ABMA13_02020 [Chthoniobacteraceae bacterium]
MRSLRLALIAAIAGLACAQDEPPKGVRITFLPPPLDGTMSVGVFSVEGRLVRVLAAEAQDDAFIIGLNGLMANWDGNDDAGAPLPAGKYFARGFAVGDVEIEGVAFHGNDWLDDDEAPRVRELRAVRLDGRELLLDAMSVEAAPVLVRLHLDSGEHSIAPTENSAQPAREVPGASESVWRIEDGVLTQRSGDELLRELEFPAEEPKPFALAAAPDRDELFLIERGANELRLRALRLKETKSEADGKKISEWEIFLTKSIAAQETFAQAAPAMGREQPPVAEEKVRVALMRNELIQVAPAALQVGVAIDEKGSLLRTVDGLPLHRLTTTPHLKWAALTREADGAITLWQSDGAVIEEYRVRKLDQMMAFDAGEYEWTGAK